MEHEACPSRRRPLLDIVLLRTLFGLDLLLLHHDFGEVPVAALRGSLRAELVLDADRCPIILQQFIEVLLGRVDVGRCVRSRRQAIHVTQHQLLLLIELETLEEVVRGLAPIILSHHVVHETVVDVTFSMRQLRHLDVAGRAWIPGRRRLRTRNRVKIDAAIPGPMQLWHSLLSGQCSLHI